MPRHPSMSRAGRIAALGLATWLAAMSLGCRATSEDRAASPTRDALQRDGDEPKVEPAPAGPSADKLPPPPSPVGPGRSPVTPR